MQAPIVRWPFVGRSAIIAELRSTLESGETAAVVLSGPAGAGKTHLVRRLASEQADRPWWWQCSVGMSTVPLGAPSGGLGDADPVSTDRAATSDAVLKRAARTLAAAGGLIVVDDLALLDARSSDLLRRLVESGSASVLATARDSSPIPHHLEWLWLGERTVHVDLPPLDRDEIGASVDALLPHLGRAERTAFVEHLHRRTAGNALFVRELLLGVLAAPGDEPSTSLASVTPSHLMRVLESRLEAAGSAVAATLERISVIGPLAITTLARVVEQAAIEQADRAGFVCLTEVGTRVVVEPSHPLYAEAAVGRMSTLQRRAVTSDVARAVLADDQSSPTERLGATAALVGLGERAPLDRLVEAAQTAFAALDHELAVTVAEAAVSAGDEFEALLILGAAHSGAGRPDEAAHALERAVAAASSDEELARAAGRLSVHLVAHGRQLAEADRVLTDAAAQISDATALAFVAADRAKLAAVRGESVELGPISESDDELGFLNSAIVGAYVAAMSGEVAACRRLIARAAPLAIEHRGVLPWSGDLIRFSAAFVSLVSDGPVAAIDEATGGLAEALVSTPGTVGTWKFLLGLIEAVAGRHGDALTHLAAAADELSGHDLIGARPLSVSARAWSLAQVGDVDAARGLLDRCVETAAADGRVRIQVAIADAWCDAIEGVSQPVKHLVAAAEAAHDDGQTVAAVLACNEALRLGGAGDVLPLLRNINRECDGWLFGFALRRARAEAERDAVQCRRLAGVAARRWPLAAAELFGRAATWARTDQSEEMVARDRLAAVVLSDKLGTHPVWTLRHIQSPLSARELAVATAVAKGDRTRDVAAAAGVSARTVENQLQSTYRKLGMRNRRELSAMFDQLV